MSHSKKDEQVEDYNSIQDQVKMLRKDIDILESADDWDTVYLQIQRIKERAKYMEENY